MSVHEIQARLSGALLGLTTIELTECSAEERVEIALLCGAISHIRRLAQARHVGTIGTDSPIVEGVDNRQANEDRPTGGLDWVKFV